MKKPPKKAVAKAKKKGKGNIHGQEWDDGERDRITVRLPAAVELGVRSYSMSKGDLAVIVRFALARVPRASVAVANTRTSGIPLGRPTLIHVGIEGREQLYEWSQSAGTSVNAVLVGLLEALVDLLARNPMIEGELRRELRARRGL